MMHQRESRSVLLSHSRDIRALLTRIEEMSWDIACERSEVVATLSSELEELAIHLAHHVRFAASFDWHRSPALDELSRFLTTSLLPSKLRLDDRELAEAALSLVQLVRSYLELEDLAIFGARSGSACTSEP